MQRLDRECSYCHNTVPHGKGCGVAQAATCPNYGGPKKKLARDAHQQGLAGNDNAAG